MNRVTRAILILFAGLALAHAVIAQSAANGTPAPTQTSVTFNVGAEAFGATGKSATPAADITLELNPAISKGYFSKVSILSDNAQAPAIDWQYYGGGLTGPLPQVFPATSQLAPLSFYWRGTAGIERIVPASGPSYSSVGAMVGGGAKWQMQNGIVVKLFEAGVIVSPRAQWGNKAPYFAGSLTYLFGH